MSILMRWMTSGTRRRVWIVDDSALDAERARRILEQSYHTETFRDGSAVLERLTSDARPDVLVLDWVMPGISGVDVCRFLRSDEGNSQMGILLLTAHRAVEQIVEGLSAGANDYLAKPYEAEELLARVASQVRARELLERAALAEESNRQLLESAPDAMFALDSNGVVIFVNPEACRVFGAPKENLLGQPVAKVLADFPRLSGLTVGDMSAPLADVEVRGRLYSPVFRVPPAPTSAVATISLRDVTASRQAEARRLDFYSIIAHDLRSPLNAMSLRTQMILTGRRGPISDELLSDVHRIDGNIRSLVVMINDFLEMARADASVLQLQPASIDLCALIDAAVEASRPVLDSRGIEWRRDVPAALDQCWISGDARRLSQVFANLIGNAVKFMPPRGTLTTRIVNKPEFVEISVEDTGPGIPPEALPTLFERYTRGPVTESQEAGTGLGLMIVRQIVEAHNGAVGVESRLGEGSRFWVRLPKDGALVSKCRPAD